MSNKSEIIVGSAPANRTRNRVRDLLEIALVFGLIIAAIWTPLGRLNSLLVWSTAACVLVFAVRGRWNGSEMGLTQPFSGAAIIVLGGAFFCGVIALIGSALRSIGPGYRVPMGQAAGYILWSLVQEFILQSVFFLRFEEIVGSRPAVFAAAALYALAHLPSPLLTVLSLFGGVLFCELFRRYRNLYPIGLIHAALGLTIAASLPDKWMHHMRVGVGYLAMR